MNIAKLKAMLVKKEDEKSKLAKRAKESDKLEEVRGINEQLETINNEIAELRGIIEEAEKAVGSPSGDEAARTKQVNGAGNGSEEPEKRSGEYIPGVGMSTVQTVDLDARSKESTEKRYKEMGEALKEQRAVTVGASSIILPQHQSSEISQTFNPVSSLIDRVTHKPLIGGESYKKPYVKGYGTGDYTAEGAAAVGAEPTFGYAEMSKAKITAYAEDTEEVEKLPAAAYAEEVEKGIRISIRKKGTREILIGDGTTNHLMGIFNSLTIDALTDVQINVINTDTLKKIIFSYGGDEEVEDEGVLILNKKDLMAFSQLKTNDGRDYHKVVTKGNVGTIDDTPFIINSACKAISDSATTSGQYCMAYGPLSNYELAIFSDIDVKKSSDYKFKEGMIAHRGNVFLGGNVVSHNGFVRVKK